MLIAHAHRPPNISWPRRSPPRSDERDENLRTEAARMLQPFVEKARLQLVFAWPLVLRGVPRKAIVQAARETAPT